MSPAHRNRAFVVLLSLTALSVVLAGWLVIVDARHATRKVDLAAVVTRYTAAAANAPYRAPDAKERTTALAGLRVLLGGDEEARRPLEPLGFTVTTAVDKATGRRYVLAATKPGSERSWGAYLVDLSRPVRVAIEVPHAGPEPGTDEVALRLFRRVPGAVLVLAGAHGGAADVVRSRESLFHAVSMELADRGVPQVQLHGLPEAGAEADVQLGAGDGPAASGLPELAATVMAGRGLTVCAAWRERCGSAASENAQAVAAHEKGALFLHVAVGRSGWDDDQTLTAVVGGLATALRTLEEPPNPS